MKIPANKAPIYFPHPILGVVSRKGAQSIRRLTEEEGAVVERREKDVAAYRKLIMDELFYDIFEQMFNELDLGFGFDRRRYMINDHLVPFR